MAKRITAMLLVILLLAGIMPRVSATEEGSDGDEVIALSSDGENVKLTADRTRQIQWIGHSKDRLTFSYLDATGTRREGWMTAITCYKVGGVYAYCIEPCVESGSTYTEDEMAVAWMTRLTANQRNAIALALAYGYPNTEHPAASSPGAAGDSTLEYPLRTDLWQISERYAATQIIIWEIVTGKRLAVAPYTCTDDSLYKSFYRTSNPYGYRADWNTLRDTYQRISASMAAHKSVPSFSSSSLAGAPTHDLMFNSTTGLYEATLTDTNQVLSGYDFQCDISGVTITRSENTLMISATPEAAAQLNGAIVSATGSMLDIDPEKVVAVWAAEGEGQTTVTLKSSPDPVTAYFMLRTEAAAEIQILKTTNTGRNLGGWQINLYTDDACTQLVAGSPFVTGEDGMITVSALAPGIYYAQEVVSDDPYWVSDTEIKSVTAEAGKTATVTFMNTHCGDLCVKKNAVNGSAEGWMFEIYDSNSNLVETITTGADGYAYSGMLLPGEYTVREIHDKDNTYWVYDVMVEKQVQVEAGGQVQVEYTNEQFGLMEFRKTTNTQNHLAGWTFLVTDKDGNPVGEYVTDDTGYACTGKLKPGRYYVQEVGSDDPYWSCDVQSYPVDVTAGKTVGHSITNLELGKGTFHKSTNTGTNLDGWIITIYADVDCTSPVSSITTDENGYGELYLEPGFYYAKETGDTKGRFEDDYWAIDSGVQEFEIEAHKDTPVSFTNTFRMGKIAVEKVDTKGEHLAGAIFLLEWSQDGINWSSVTYSDSADAVPGGCSNPSLKEGCLTTGADGLVEWGNLYPGLLYRITEVEAPEGYVLLTDNVFVGELPVEDLTVTLTVVNSLVFELPATGSNGVILLSVGQALCFGLCFFMLLFHRKRT